MLEPEFIEELAMEKKSDPTHPITEEPLDTGTPRQDPTHLDKSEGILFLDT